jgi:hypothetical protein
MPNFELSDDHRSSLRGVCRRLCEVRTLTMEQGFPLSQEDVQQGILPAEMRDLFNRLKAMGAESVRNTRSPSFFVGGEGIDREVAINITGVQNLWYAYEIQDGAYVAGEQIKQRNEKFDKKLFFNNAVLAPETYKKLVRWINLGVREHRQAALLNETLVRFLHHSGMTLGHIIARWPGLTLVFDEMDRGGYISSRSKNSWRDRVRQLPATKNRWGWPAYGDAAVWYEKNKKILAVCDEMLVGAAQLDRPHTPGMAARIVGWRRKEGEKI